MEEFKIEKGIPIIPKRGMCKYPFEKMEVGDSFIAGNTSRNLRGTVGSLANRFILDNPEYKTWKFSAKDCDGKLRVWRIR